MSVPPEAYFETQARLTTWTDELEFLGYILCELIDADKLNERGYRCHQAADLPAIIDIIRLQLKDSNGRLATVMGEDQSKALRRLMTQAKRIRNDMAHHTTQNEHKLGNLEETKRSLCDLFEYAIKAVASERGISQITWSPCYHICKTYIEERGPLTVTIPLNEESLLLLRQRALQDHDISQKGLLYRRPKRKATEESRKKQRDDYEAAVTRRRQKQERDLAMRSSHLTRKLQNLEQRFRMSRELRSAQINVLADRMRAEQEMFHRQREEILQSGLLQPAGHEPILLITIFLAVSSPLWIPGALIYHMYNRFSV
ncbi:uncharacterized protein BO72DRAFT_501839 [Aspergillus fijiensis CBS 313.89]|uniref:Uncharacterized protein n=1 Tax=Aspergillus fijiensis CBS 313.89 TaxID=1448319 RepID=A0A8G1VTW4_9EURO|nr:uncharacterized protein BO72DRAFT_501839 [Aspergillus fijiensis CBS 313.89]RAK71491.1 hypothetical protein BO72DRAFT_501839 [Aspergillus fijiensis CBS 313.89]